MSPPSQAPRGVPRHRYEIQVHPADIQKGVWYLFLDRRHLLAGVAVALGLAAYLGFGAWIAPAVAERLARRHEAAALQQAHLALGDRLVATGQRLAELQTTSESLRLQIGRIYLAYGLEQDAVGEGGYGGYPAVPLQVPDSSYRERLTEVGALEASLRQEAAVLATFLDEIRGFEEEHRDQLATTPSRSPLESDDFVLTSPFGERVNPFTKARDFHSGVDLSAPSGTPVYATADGLVTFAGRYSARQSVAWWRYGNLVSIKNGDGFVTLFGHLDEIKVKDGQRVKQGDLIGTVGNTGWSTNPHLHYEVRRRLEEEQLRPVDPRIYILDHRWRDEEKLLVRARAAPNLQNFEPLPRRIAR
ncbi:MAG TPA: M23 family metallopeptidase [Thermoanaerobaculia bacterium]|nr:M23 family metallopeptidase [Thermoanaerobaculia bacterium]